MPAQKNRSLANGLACLEAVAAAGSPVGSREVARLLGEEHTKVNRLLGTLADLGLVVRDARRRYLPGPGLHVLSAMSLRGSGLLAAALPELEALADGRSTIALGLLWQRHVCYLVHAAGGRAPADSLGAHAPYPAHESVLGLALLARRTDPEVRRLLAMEPEPVGRQAIAACLRSLETVRRDGHAVRDLGGGRRSVACTVGEPALAAVALLGRFPPSRLPGVVRRLRGAAKRIENAL